VSPSYRGKTLSPRLLRNRGPSSVIFHDFWAQDLVLEYYPIFLKEERYRSVPRLSDTRYSVKGTKGLWRYSSSDLNIWLCGRQADLSVMGVRVGVAN